MPTSYALLLEREGSSNVTESPFVRGTGRASVCCPVAEKFCEMRSFPSVNEFAMRAFASCRDCADGFVFASPMRFSSRRTSADAVHVALLYQCSWPGCAANSVTGDRLK